jgi:hypothetical protein
VLQQLTLLEYAVDKKNQATQKSCASDFDYIDGLEQQEASINGGSQVSNDWSIDNKENCENGNNIGNSNKSAIAIDFTWRWECEMTEHTHYARVHPTHYA